MVTLWGKIYHFLELIRLAEHRAIIIAQVYNIKKIIVFFQFVSLFVLIITILVIFKRLCRKNHFLYQ